MSGINPGTLFAAEPEITVVELRQYTLRGGRREDLVRLFEREFIEPQEVVGALEAFYTGAVWRANSSAANATMLDSDNVLLLRPLPKSEGLVPHRSTPAGVLRISIHNLAQVPHWHLPTSSTVLCGQ